MPLLLLLFQILFLVRVTSSEHQRVTLGERRGTSRNGKRWTSSCRFHIFVAVSVLRFIPALVKWKTSCQYGISFGTYPQLQGLARALAEISSSSPIHLTHAIAMATAKPL